MITIIFLFIVLLCLMLYCCFLFDALTFIATQLYKMYAQCTYLCVDGSSCQLSICIWFSATNTFRSTSFSKQRISNPTFRNTQQSTCNKKSNVLYESLQTWIIILNEHNFTKHEFWHISCIHLVTNISGFFETNSLSMFIYESIRHMQNDEKITLQFMFK